MEGEEGGGEGRGSGGREDGREEGEKGKEGKERIKSEENKKIVGEWKLFFYFRKKSTYINFYKIYFNNLFF